jgi:hypothetical protein
MLYDCPFYITPHAVDRFRERVSRALPTKTVREIINSRLQKGRKRLLGYARWNRQIAPFYAAKYAGVRFLIPISIDGQKRNAWPEVPTILNDDIGQVHWERGDGRGKCLKLLWSAGLKKSAIAAILEIGEATVTRLVKKYGLPPRRRPQERIKWTAAESEALGKLLTEGAGAKEILRYFSENHLERPSSTVRVKIHRLKNMPAVTGAAEPACKLA